MNYADFIAKAMKRRQLALRLHRQNKTYTAIGEKLNCSRQRAYQIVQQALKAEA